MTIKYKKTLFGILGLRENIQKTNMEVGGSPSQGWGSDFMEKGIFQPKGEQKNLLVCPAWRWSAVSWASRGYPPEWRQRTGDQHQWCGHRRDESPLGCEGNLGANGVGRLLDTGAGKKLWDTSSHFNRGVERLSPDKDSKVAEDTEPMAGAEPHHMFALSHHRDCPPLLPFAAAVNSRRTHSLQCPSRALYWEKLIICLL